MGSALEALYALRARVALLRCSMWSGSIPVCGSTAPVTAPATSGTLALASSSPVASNLQASWELGTLILR